MSIKIMTMVWDAFPASGSELLTMLAMADWANDDGGSLHPSMRAIAEKVRVSEKQARRIVQGLVADGYLMVVGNAYGGAPGATKNWVINVKKLKQMAAEKDAADAQTPPMCGSGTPPIHVPPPTPPTSVTPPMGVPRPLPPVSQTPPTHGSQTTIEPPIEPPIREDSARKRALAKPDDVSQVAFDGWLEVRKAKRAGKPTELVWSAMRREAAKAGLTIDEAVTQCVEIGWQAFVADWYASRTSKSQPATQRAGRHTGFSTKDYNAGVNQDGTFD